MKLDRIVPTAVGVLGGSLLPLELWGEWTGDQGVDGQKSQELTRYHVSGINRAAKALGSHPGLDLVGLKSWWPKPSTRLTLRTLVSQKPSTGTL